MSRDDRGATVTIGDDGADPTGATVPSDAGGRADAGAPIDQVARYRIVRRLGAGGMGVVYVAHDPELNRDVALKLVHPHRRDLTTQARLVAEAQAMARLQHPNVIAVHDVGMVDGRVFVTMDLIEGGSLAGWADGSRSWQEVVAIASAAGRGLAAAHAAGIVHRDFKPDNVLRARDGRVLVTDFGIARLAGDDGDDGADGGAADTATALRLTQTGSVIGTPAYMAPEQLRGEPADARADQFSFCVFLFEALYGARPFEPAGGATTFERLRAAVLAGRVITPPAARRVPAWLHRAVVRGLAGDPADRFPSMGALLEAITPPPRRGWWIAGGAAIAMTAAVIAALILTRDAPVVAPVATPEQACATASDRAASVWSPAARAAAVAARAGSPFADADLATFDAYATRWARERRALCLRSVGAPADPIRDQQAACLDRAIASLGTAAAAHDHVELWPALDSLTACASSPRTGAPRWHALAGRVDQEDDLLLAHDGDRIFHHSGDQLYVSTLDGLDVGTYSLPGEGYLRAVFRDQRRVLLVRDHSGVVRDLTTGAERVIAAVPNDLVGLTPDERSISYADGKVLRARALDGAAAPPAVDGGAPISGFAWSPDGSRVALLTGADGVTTIRVLVPATGAFRDHPYRLNAGVFVTLAWLDDERLLLASDSVWSLRLGDDGALLEPPSVRIASEPGQRHMIDAVGGGHAVLRRIQVRDDLMRLASGRAVAVGRSIDNTGVLGVDDAGARIAVRRDDAIFWVSLRDGRLSPAGRWRGIVAVRDGHLLAVDRRDAGGWRIIELDAGGRGREIAVVPAELGAPTPEIACGAPPASRCLVYTTTGDRVRGVTLDGQVVGAVRTLPITPGALVPAISPDGHRLGVGALDRGVQILDLDTGAERTLRGPAGCLHQFVAWPPTGDAVFVSLLCPGPSELVELRPGGATRVTYSGNLWIAGVATTANGAILASLRTSMRDAAWLDDL
jgi:hypothetical protein